MVLFNRRKGVFEKMTDKEKNWHRHGAKTKLQKCWIWNQTVSEFVKTLIPKGSMVLNCPCGMSDIGDVKVDIEPKQEGVIKADMSDLPFEDNSFDVVVSDPPWKIGFYQRMTPFFECVRVCRVGGIIIYNAYWVPESKASFCTDTIIRQDMPWSNASVISVHKKHRDVLTEEKRYKESKGGV